MTARLRLASLAAALLISAGAAAQPAPGTPADAELAAVRLVDAVRARDWRSLATFVDPEITAVLGMGFAETTRDIEDELRSALDMDDADSLVAAVRATGYVTPPGVDPDLGVLVHMVDWMRALSADGRPDGQTLVERVLALVAGCTPASESPLSAFDDVTYTPVRADVRDDGTVEVVGMFSRAIEGEPEEILAVTPLRWTGDRWTVTVGPFAARDAELNPAAEIVSGDPDGWLYGVVYAMRADVRGDMPGCSRDGK